MPTPPPRKPTEYWFIFQDKRLLLLENDDKITPVHGESLITLLPYLQHQHTIGIYNEVICYCAEISVEITLPPAISPASLRKAFEALGMPWYTPAARAISIIQWDKNHQFCGHCGRETHFNPPHFERTCPACGLSVYPRISPSVIVLIKKGSQLLMSRSPHFTPGAFGLIAGFVEAGESLEETVHREVKEEVSLTIKNLRYFGSQSWPFPDSLMVGFTADYDSGEIIIDPTEIEMAGWYDYDNLPGRPSTSVSIAHKMIEQFIKEQQGIKHGTL